MNDTKILCNCIFFDAYNQLQECGGIAVNFFILKATPFLRGCCATCKAKGAMDFSEWDEITRDKYLK